MSSEGHAWIASTAGSQGVHHGLVAFLGFRLFLHVGKTAGKHGFHSGGIQFRTGSMVAHTQEESAQQRTGGTGLPAA